MIQVRLNRLPVLTHAIRDYLVHCQQYYDKREAQIHTAMDALDDSIASEPDEEERRRLLQKYNFLKQSCDNLLRSQQILLDEQRSIAHKGIETVEQYAAAVKQSLNMTDVPTAACDNQDRSLTGSPSPPLSSCVLTEEHLQNCRKLNNGYMYDTPDANAEILDYHQGRDPLYCGNCGLVSCENVLRLAGRVVTQKEVNARYREVTLYKTRLFSVNNGATNARERQAVLESYGIHSEIVSHPSVEKIAQSVCEGRGVIVSVFLGRLLQRSISERDYHTVVVTSVLTDDQGNVTRFIVCDSGSSQPMLPVDPETLAFSLTGNPFNITGPIR